MLDVLHLPIRSRGFPVVANAARDRARCSFAKPAAGLLLAALESRLHGLIELLNFRTLLLHVVTPAPAAA